MWYASSYCIYTHPAVEVLFQIIHYSVTESDEEVLVCVEIRGTLERNVEVTVSTQENGFAQGQINALLSVGIITSNEY